MSQSQHSRSQAQNNTMTASTVSNEPTGTITNNDGVLFACTKCNARHRFEELSRRHQLCRTCKASYKVISCDYCRCDFKKEVGSKPSTICEKCEQLQDQYGKPSICICCNIKAAFIGTRCQRCNNSEKKYGPPVNCEHCHQKCAFDRQDPDSKAKVDGKTLCWLCTMTFKRDKAKAKHSKESSLSKSSSSRHQRKSPIKGAEDKGDGNMSNHHRHRSPNTAQSGHKLNDSNNSHHHKSSHSSHRRSHHNISHHRDQPLGSVESASQPNLKRMRLDQRSHILSNGHLSSNHKSSLTDSNGNDLASVVTQLKDQMAALNKKLNLKERELISKDQQVSMMRIIIHLNFSQNHYQYQ